MAWVWLWLVLLPCAASPLPERVALSAPDNAVALTPELQFLDNRAHP